MPSYLIYHPKRVQSVIDGITIYHDTTTGNQDPYIWNKQFLHTYCHITQITSEGGQINFWVSGDTFPNFSHLYCDLVFVIQQKLYWEQTNYIERTNPLVESDETFNDHYQWAMYQHPLTRRRRYTLKADPKSSFQPQSSSSSLLDVLPFLVKKGIDIESLRKGMQAGRGSKPFRLESKHSDDLYKWLVLNANIKLNGFQLQMIRLIHNELASPVPKAIVNPPEKVQSPKC